MASLQLAYYVRGSFTSVEGASSSDAPSSVPPRHEKPRQNRVTERFCKERGFFRLGVVQSFLFRGRRLCAYFVRGSLRRVRADRTQCPRRKYLRPPCWNLRLAIWFLSIPSGCRTAFTDVLIIGGGLAGLRAAMAVDPTLGPGGHQGQSAKSNSHYAQGGIAGVFDPEDRFEDHIADTLTAGGKLCDPAVVEMVVREAPERIRELIGWGTQFDVEAGELALGREGGHSHDRIVHALGDATGKEVMRAVIAWIEGLTNVETWPNTFTLDLLTHKGVCRGALVWNPEHGKTLVWAKQTILCTGGVGQIYRETTNPDVATGDGLAAAYRAGAELRDMEFMQFHPTVLYIAG